jgi:cbb3-type cytochrome oxidase subunit 1
MEWFVKAFLKSSVFWLAAGVTLGVGMAAHPPWAVYRPAHLHMLLLGFVAMMIFGVGYHVIPRIAGNPLQRGRAPMVHWWLANVGLTLMAVGFIGRASGWKPALVPLAVGGALAAAGAYVFAFVVWRTVDGKRRPLRATQPEPGLRARNLKVM